MKFLPSKLWVLTFLFPAFPFFFCFSFFEIVMMYSSVFRMVLSSVYFQFERKSRNEGVNLETYAKFSAVLQIVWSGANYLGSDNQR